MTLFHSFTKKETERQAKPILSKARLSTSFFFNYYSTSLFGDPHKNLLYKRNINLYKYLQKGGRGRTRHLVLGFYNNPQRHRSTSLSPTFKTQDHRVHSECSTNYCFRARCVLGQPKSLSYQHFPS